MQAARVGPALLAAAMLDAAAQAPAAVGLPPDTLVMLVAPWCGPCWGELARLDGLAAAAAPLSLRVLVMDDGPRARAMVADLPPERRWDPAPPDRAAVRAALWTRTPGLPFAVATDGHGAICAQRDGALEAARARALARSCHPGQ